MANSEALSAAEENDQYRGGGQTIQKAENRGGERQKAEGQYRLVLGTRMVEDATRTRNIRPFAQSVDSKNGAGIFHKDASHFLLGYVSEKLNPLYYMVD